MARVDIYDRVFQFACRVVQMDRTLSRNRKVSRSLMNQLVRAATSVGANLEEARAGQSKADFHSKLRIALKEAREAHYWLRLISAAGMLSEQQIEPLVNEGNQIVAILTTIAKTANPRGTPILHS